MVVVYNLQHSGTHKSDDTHKGTEQQLNWHLQSPEHFADCWNQSEPFLASYIWPVAYKIYCIYIQYKLQSTMVM